MKSFFAKLKFKRQNHLDPLNRAEKISLSWLVVVLFTIAILIGLFWYAISEFNYWSNIESQIMVDPPNAIRYNQKGASEVIEHYQFMMQELQSVQEIEVQIIIPSSVSEGQSVRVGQ